MVIIWWNQKSVKNHEFLASSETDKSGTFSIKIKDKQRTLQLLKNNQNSLQVTLQFNVS